MRRDIVENSCTSGCFICVSLVIFKNHPVFNALRDSAVAFVAYKASSSSIIVTLTYFLWG